MVAVRKTADCSFNFCLIYQQQLEGRYCQKQKTKNIQVFEATTVAGDEQP